MTIEISGKVLSIKNIKGPTGVRGRNSDNHLFKEKIGWTPSNLEKWDGGNLWLDRKTGS